MVFQCEKCKKVFERQLHLNQHAARKLPCNREIKCERCFKEFTQLSDLKRHMNRRYPCGNKREEMLLQLKIKDKELLIEQEKTKQLVEKTKQAKLEHKSSITSGNHCNNNLLNIFGDNITNIYNINEVKSIAPKCHYDAEKLIKTDNLDETIKQLVNLHFNNDDHPKNKCIAIKDGKIYSLIDDNVVEFKRARPEFNKIIKETCKSVEYDYGKYSDDEMCKFGVGQRENHLSKDESNTLKKVSQYIGNNRNNGYIDSVIIVSLN
jgi:uncharacterized C2H2 Zn-finger protein